MSVKNYQEDPEIEDREWDEAAVSMIRDEDDDNELLNRINTFEDEDDQSDDYDDDVYEDDYEEEEDDYGLGMYFDEPPRSHQRWKKPRRKRNRQSSHSGRRFRWDDDGVDDW